jgi:hypothetical protein
MRPREFRAPSGGAAAGWPLVARWQQQTVPMVGLLSTSSADEFVRQLAGFHKGLADLGYVEAHKVIRAVNQHRERLPDISADLVLQTPAVIFMVAVQRALRETEYFKGQASLTEYRCPDHQQARLPELATDLVRAHVAVICQPHSTPREAGRPPGLGLVNRAQPVGVAKRHGSLRSSGEKAA